MNLFHKLSGSWHTYLDSKEVLLILLYMFYKETGKEICEDSLNALIYLAQKEGLPLRYRFLFEDKIYSHDLRRDLNYLHSFGYIEFRNTSYGRNIIRLTNKGKEKSDVLVTAIGGKAGVKDIIKYLRPVKQLLKI